MAGFYNCLRGQMDHSIVASGLSDVAKNQEPTDTPDECPGKKRSKFQTFKNLFAKKKRKESSQSTDEVNTPEPSLVQSDTSHDSESQVNMGNKSMSHDSVFISDSPSSETNDGLISSQENIHGKVKSLQSSNPDQRTTSFSLEGSDRDDDQGFSWTASPLTSLPVDFSQPASPASCLDSSAARHRIAIRHKAFAKRKPASREMPEGSNSKVLGGVLGLNEELSAGNTESAAQEEGCKVVQVELHQTGGDMVEEQGERTDAEHLISFQQTGEDHGIKVQLSMEEEEHSTVQYLSDIGSQHMDVSSSITKRKMDPEEILPALEVQESQQTGGGVNDQKPGSLLQEEHAPTLLPVSDPGVEAPKTPQGCGLEVILVESQATLNIPHAEELSPPSPYRASAKRNQEEWLEESGECDEEKEVVERVEDRTKKQSLPEEQEEEVSPLLTQEEEEAVLDSADKAGLLSNTYSNSECGSNTSLEFTMERSRSIQTMKGGKCPPEPQIIRASNSDSVLPYPEETSTATANIYLCVDSEPNSEKQAVLQAPVVRKPQASLGSRTRFTIAPAWQRLLQGGTSQERPFTAQVETKASKESPNGARDPCYKVMDQKEEPLHPQKAAALSWPDVAKSAGHNFIPRDHSPQDLGSPENQFGIKLRTTSALLRYSATGSSEVLGNPTPKEPINPQKLPMSQPPSTKSSPLKKVDNSSAKVKKTPELTVDAPERKVASPSWVSAARQNKKIFNNNLQEETPGRESPLVIEPQRKISLPLSLNQTSKEQPKPSSPLTAMSCSREISRPATVEEQKRVLSHSPPSPLGQEEPPWLALAKKKAKAWSEMPQTVQ
ncbi:hypothetical protein COCON_G00081850 [Conger conger]|uniref:DUF4592 domain-containing protein n=1 Tax=Conger conger TaxID=82655 RepID=A0A9Q1DPS0_CONCO|nr:hypothetical protein COCON_G00081850 [Conger conger]